MSTNKIAFITGATAGIGLATAKLLAANNYDVIINGRRGERLEKLAAEIQATGKARALPLVFDVRDARAVEKAVASLPADWQKIDVLVNNAGLARGLSPVQEGQISDWDEMIDTNIKGLLYVTRMVSPGMVSRCSGHIINIGSIAAKQTYYRGNVYCSTKHALQSLTQGMRIDMLEAGVKVSAIHPGMAETEFSIVRFHGDKQKADEVYKNFEPLVAEDIAQAVLFAVTRPPHVNVDDMLVMPTAQADMMHKKLSDK